MNNLQTRSIAEDNVMGWSEASQEKSDYVYGLVVIRNTWAAQYLEGGRVQHG